MHRIPQVWPGWQAEELIGSSLHGNVFRAWSQTGDGISVAAIKIIEVPMDDGMIANLRARGVSDAAIRSHARMIAGIISDRVERMIALGETPNLVEIEECRVLDRQDGVGCSVLIRMELLERLPDEFERGGVDVRTAVKTGVDVLRALQVCHDAGIVHLNVKPQNVLVSFSGDHKLSDAGLSYDSDGRSLVEILASDEAYTAPEVEGGAFDARADVYSAGVMLYRWLSRGSLPYVAERRLAELRGESPECFEPRFDDYANPPLDVDFDLSQIIYRAVAESPDDRWQSAAAFGDALQAWLDASGPRSMESRLAEARSLVSRHTEATPATAQAPTIATAVEPAAVPPASPHPRLHLDRGSVLAERIGGGSTTLPVADVYVTDAVISDARDMRELLGLVGRRSITLLILARDYGDQALRVLRESEAARNGDVCAVRVPGYGSRVTDIAGDIAAIVGADFSSGAQLGGSQPGVPRSGHLGSADIAIVTATDTYVEGCGGAQALVDRRIRLVDEAMASTYSNFDREKLQERRDMLQEGLGAISDLTCRSNHARPLLFHGRDGG